MNLAAQFLRRGGQVPGRIQRGVDGEAHYGAGFSPTAGLAASWAEEHLGSAEKIDQPQGGTGTVSDAAARHSRGRA